MIKTVIIDDEPEGRNAVANILTRYCDGIEIIGEADTVASGIKLIQSVQPQLVFLDIQMPDGSGFKVLENCTDFTFHVVFVTAYHQYAIKAFQFSAIDYLLKPVNPEQLIHAVEKVKNFTPSLSQAPDRIATLLNNKNKLNKLALPTLNGYRFIKIDNIIRCEASSNYTIFYLNSGKSIMVTRTLKEYEQILDEKKFMRVHQSHLINLEYVSSYLKGEGGTAIMNDGAEVEISRRKKEQFLLRML